MRFHALARVVGLAGALAWSGCGTAMRGAAAPGSALGTGPLEQGGPLRLAPDPTVLGARFVPIAAPRDALGTEPGGGARAIENGVRVVALPGGAMLAADDRFSAPPTQVLPLPERLGGGFLFVVGGTSVWRAERWLGPARLLYTSASRIGRVIGSRVFPSLVAGLDRVYLQTEHEIWHAIDGERGTELPLGPWPSSPSVGAYAAADGWRAIATADLRGTIATFDAGATWRPLHVPPDEREAKLLADVDSASGHAPHADASPGATTERGGGGPLGTRPLVAVVEDGWPLDDGTAIIARDGVLARVRVEDGAVQSLDPAAYPLRPSRCHAIALATPGGSNGVGFVCGEPRGSTVVYSFDAARGRMNEDRRFDSPRVVLPSGNGAVSVRGSCDAHAASEEPSAHAYCVRARDGEWRETRLTGAIGVEARRESAKDEATRGSAEKVSSPIREHVVALGDGRLALVWPPSDLAGARVMVIDGAAVHSVPIAFPEMSPDIRRALEDGLWLDGFEERRPGVLGGWISSGGSMLGIEVGLDGALRFGTYVRDSGARIVSGRYGLGWTKGRVGLETTDGGMTWTAIDGPSPIDDAPPAAACGPIGCEVAGWLRVGWHEAKRAIDASAAPPPASREGPVLLRAPIALSCEGLVVPAGSKGRDPLAAFPTPTTTSDENRFTFHATDLREGHDIESRTASLARVQAWGPRGSDWERSAKWTVQWASPFAAADEAHTTAPAIAPPLFANLERIGATAAPQWVVATADDPAHGLLLAQTGGREGVALALFELEADRAPLAIRTPDSGPFGRIDAALRAGGHWYVASHTQPNEAIVWRVDGPSARELARLPRWFDRGRTGAPIPRLAWRTDGHALGFVVDGGATIGHRGTTRWVASIDLESGAVGDVELVGTADLTDAEALTACAADDAGWLLDAPFPSNLEVGGAGAGSLGSPEASHVGRVGGLLSGILGRVRLGGSHPCIERLSGRLSLPHMTQFNKSTPEPRARAHALGASITVTATRDDERDLRSFRCWIWSPDRARVVGFATDAP